MTKLHYCKIHRCLYKKRARLRPQPLAGWRSPGDLQGLARSSKPRTTALELCRFGFSCCSFPPLHALGGLSVTLLNSINDGLHEGNQPGTKPFNGYKPALGCPSMQFSCDPQDYLTFGLLPRAPSADADTGTHRRCRAADRLLVRPSVR